MLRLFAFIIALSFSPLAHAERDLDYAGLPSMNFMGGDQWKTALKKTENGKVSHFGLIRNGERLVYTGEVVQTDEEWGRINFFRDHQRIYVSWSGGEVVPLLGLPPGDLPFETFTIDQKTLPEELRAKALFWKGIRVKTPAGVTQTIWASDNALFYYLPADGDIHGAFIIKEPPPLPFVYVRVKDFLSWHSANNQVADISKSRYTLFGVTHDAEHGLVFDWLDVRPEPKDYVAYVQSRNLGRREAARGVSFFGHVPKTFLSTIYQAFRNQPKRAAFDERLLLQIQTEDRQLGPDRLVYLWADDEYGRMPGGIRLYQGFDSPQFITKDFRTPVEREYKDLRIRERFPGEVLYELNRLSVRKDLVPWVDTRQLVGTLLAYMDARNLPHGRFLLHTDEYGSTLFPHVFGAKIEWGADETPDGNYVLSVTYDELKKKVFEHRLPGLTLENLRSPHGWCEWKFR